MASALRQHDDMIQRSRTASHAALELCGLTAGQDLCLEAYLLADGGDFEDGVVLEPRPIEVARPRPLQHSICPK